MLVVNAGSSSLKLRLVGDGDELIASSDLPPVGGRPQPARLAAALPVGRVDAVGHRIVHGGERFREAVPVTDEVERRLRQLTALAPLHQPKSLAALDWALAALPNVPHVACFDTAFHATLPAAASTYALPAEWRERYRLKRYGFHGLSHAYASRRAATLLDAELTALRTVTCHLGAGASLAAVERGRSIDTTMGFTPLDGLVMATRSGSVDPGLIIWLLGRGELRPADLGEALEHRSGLVALAGTADMRELLQRSDAEAAGALDVYLHHLRSGIAQMVASMGGLDALVFTGGVGENAPTIRRRACEPLGHLGIEIDAAANSAIEQDGDVAIDGSPARVLVVRAREDLEVARQVRSRLGA